MHSPHVSLAVWDVPPTVVAGRSFSIKAGATSSDGRDLRGRRIEVCDARGAVVAAAVFQDAPWPGTEALAWTELAVSAPAEHGPASLSVRLATDQSDPLLGDATFRFTTVVMPPPQHAVSIEVVAQETATALAGAEIRLGPYRATTAASGRAELRVAAGRYELRSWKVGFDTPPSHIDVTGDLVIRVEAATVVEENVDRAWRA